MVRETKGETKGKTQDVVISQKKPEKILCATCTPFAIRKFLKIK